MCISDTESYAKQAAKTAFIYLVVCIFCALFGAVYEIYSHEVYSFYMIYAFAFPLVGGTLPFSVLSLAKAKHYPNAMCRNLYHFGIATLTVGSIVRGVLDIYGTTNGLVFYYWIVGVVLAGIGLIVYMLSVLRDIFRTYI